MFDRLYDAFYSVFCSVLTYALICMLFVWVLLVGGLFLLVTL